MVPGACEGRHVGCSFCRKNVHTRGTAPVPRRTIIVVVAVVLVVVAIIANAIAAAVVVVVAVAVVVVTGAVCRRVIPSKAQTSQNASGF